MNDFYADKRYYIDLEKVVLLEYIDGEDNRKISISMSNGKTYSFYESQDWDYQAFKALKAWHERKITQGHLSNIPFREETR